MMQAEAALNDVTTDIEANSIGGQYLTFMLSGEEYGIEILKVQEIKGFDTVTPIPNTPVHMLGVLNLRGSIIPIVDLRKRFNLESIPYGATTVVIVVKVEDETEQKTVGLVVDAVADVYRLESDNIQPSPEMGHAINTEFVKGLATVDDKMVILLAVDRLANFKELSAASVPGDPALEVVAK